MPQLDPIAKFLIVIGVVLVFIGVAWQFGWIQSLRLGRLPGDISIEKENMKFYFPITTCILLSIIYALVSWIFKK